LDNNNIIIITISSYCLILLIKLFTDIPNNQLALLIQIIN